MDASGNPPRDMRAAVIEKPRGHIGFWTGLRQFYGLLSPQRRRQFHALSILMLLGALAELATIGSVLPFLSLLADSDGLGRLPWAMDVLDAMGAVTGRERLLGVTFLFCAFAVLAGLIRFQLTSSTQDFIFRVAHELSVETLRRILLQPYSFHLTQNTSTLLAAFDKLEVFVFEVLLPLAQAAIGAFIAAFIIVALIYIDPFTALVATLGFSAIYIFVSAVARSRLAANSSAMASAWDERMKLIQESLGGIRDVIIDKSHRSFLGNFERVDKRLNLARANTAVVAAAPRYLIETLGMVAIAGVALVISQREEGLAGALPILGAIALGAQRLLPLLQQVYNGWSTASGHRSAVTQTFELLRLPIGDRPSAKASESPLPFEKSVRVDRVTFAYPSGSAPALTDITLEIPRGSLVALVGKTGSGKSTLADLLMGLLEPTEGRILVDGVPLTQTNRDRWQQGIAHVPQAVFVADTSIASNIAFGLEDEAIDRDRVMDSAKKAQLHDFIESLPNGYDTCIGEGGVRLSGGQRQRLGIARAIYKQAPVLVLDEATNALDEATEAAVMGSLDELRNEGRTIIIIAHRASKIARCDLMARLHNGRLVELEGGRSSRADAS